MKKSSFGNYCYCHYSFEDIITINNNYYMANLMPIYKAQRIKYSPVSCGFLKDNIPVSEKVQRDIVKVFFNLYIGVGAGGGEVGGGGETTKSKWR